MIFVGLGCRSRCAPEDILAAVAAALSKADRSLSAVHALYAPEARRDTAGLFDAAAALGKRLELIDRSQLAAQSARVVTHSARVLERIGAPSAAEAAALAGAFEAQIDGEVRLLGARSVAGDATCALAELEAR